MASQTGRLRCAQDVHLTCMRFVLALPVPSSHMSLACSFKWNHCTPAEVKASPHVQQCLSDANAVLRLAPSSYIPPAIIGDATLANNSRGEEAILVATIGGLPAGNPCATEGVKTRSHSLRPQMRVASLLIRTSDSVFESRASAEGLTLATSCRNIFKNRDSGSCRTSTTFLPQ